MPSSTSNLSSGVTTPTSISSANASGIKNQLKMNTGTKALDARDQMQKKPTTPIAWQRGSTNPVTQRIVSNGVTSKTSTSSKGPPVPSKDLTAADKMPANNLAFLTAQMRGLPATLTLKNGEQYTGIFSTLNNTHYTIKMAKKTTSSGKQTNGISDEHVGEGPDRALTLEVNDVVDCKVDGVRLDKLQGRSQNGASSSFRTDTDISAQHTVRERNLQKWEPANDTQVDMSLDNRLGDWDQFAAHKQLTGLDSTYDENNYTTRLDTSAPGFREKMSRADRIAREIETSATINVHQAEERGQKLPEDSGVDEESKYSGVQRTVQPLASGQPNRYTPPARRGLAGQPTTVATPADDPAIISSSRPEAPAPKPSAEPVAEKPAEPTTAVVPPPKESTTTPVPAVAEKAQLPVPSIKTFASTQSPSTRGEKKEGGATETIEKDVMNAFKQFTAHEKLRIQEHQRTAARRDKAVKLNDLKKFAENFKLNTAVPPDLVPILAKDKKKQQEIMDKAKKHTDETKTTPPRVTAPSVAPPTDPKSAKPTVNRNEPGLTSPQAPNERQNQQRSRPNPPNFSQSMRGPPPHLQQQMGGMPPRQGPGNLGQRLNATQQQHRQNTALANQHHAAPVHDTRMPPAGPALASGMQSPTSASMRWNPKASFTPNPTSQTFVPSSNPSNGSSPVREPASKPPPVERKPTQSNLFDGRTEGRKSIMTASERVSLKKAFNPIERMHKEVKAAVEANAKAPQYTDNGGIPYAYRTAPTWDVAEENHNKTIVDCFQTVPRPLASTQHPMINQQPYQHQLPFQPQHGGQMQHGPTPQLTPRHHHAQVHHGGPGTPHHYEDPHRMQYSQSTSSIQPSPRSMPQYLFNGQTPQPNGFYQQPVPGYPGGQPMFVRQTSTGPQFIPQGPIAGHMMNGQQPAGPYIPMNPPMVYPVQNQVYPQQGNGMPPQGPPNGYGSPRGAPMMSQQGSQQGHPGQQIVYMQPGHGPAMYSQGPGGPMTPMRAPYAQLHQPPYASSPHQHFQQQQHRATPSASYVQPMMGGPQGMPPNGVPMGPDGAEDGK